MVKVSIYDRLSYVYKKIVVYDKEIEYLREYCDRWKSIFQYPKPRSTVFQLRCVIHVLTFNEVK